VPTSRAKKPRSLEDYADLFVLLRELGVESVAIGGCAVGVRRPKDRPHIRILEKFLNEEVVRAFEHEADPRERLAPAMRLLGVLGAETLDSTLAKRLIPLEQTGRDFRFLAHRVPTRALAKALRVRATGGAHEQEAEALLVKRRF
jgi:hypothetical protein